MNRWLLALALTFATCGNALALPGQSEKQLAVWGEANAAFTGFHRTFDSYYQREKYVATLLVEGHHANFSSMPVNGIVPHEQIAFVNMAANWNLARDWKFDIRVLHYVYGASEANDALHPVTGFAVRHVAVRLGKRFAYAAVGHTLLIYQRNLYQSIVLAAKACDYVDCEGEK